MKNFSFNIARFTVLCFCSIAALVISCGKSSSYGNAPSSTNISYMGTFSKTSPTYVTNAFGNVTATFNTNSLQLTYTITWDSLSTLPVAMHFHDNGPVIVPITGFAVALNGSIQGVCTLTEKQAQDLAAGYIYAMIHTSKYTSGEIQAYLAKQ